MLARLMRRLVPQCTDFGHCLNWDEMLTILLYENRLEFSCGVEWLIDQTPKGVPDSGVEGGIRSVSIGEKRNNLVKRAKGERLCFQDDDDLLSPRFIKAVLGAIAVNPDVDVLGFQGILRPRNVFSAHRETKFIHTLECKEWKTEGGIHWRSPNHINVVKKSLSEQVPFPCTSYGEDHDQSKRLLPLLKTEVMLTEPDIYEYYA